MHVLHGAIEVRLVDSQSVPLRQPRTLLEVLDPSLLVPGLTFGWHVGHFQFLGNRFRVPCRAEPQAVYLHDQLLRRHLPQLPTDGVGCLPGMTGKSGNRKSPGPGGA